MKEVRLDGWIVRKGDRVLLHVGPRPDYPECLRWPTVLKRDTLVPSGDGPEHVTVIVRKD